MSSVSSTYQASGPAGSTAPTVPAGMSDQWPALCAVLAGVRTADGLKWELSPCTISLFADCGKLKFCISPKEGLKVAFGTIDRVSDGLDGLEHALEQGHYEWKTSRRR